MKSIDEAFAKTTKLLFGKEFGPIDDYEDWLLNRVPRGEMVKSSLSKRKILVPNYSVFRYVPKDKVAGLDSIEELSKRQIMILDDENVSSISKKLKDIAGYITEFIEGENVEVKDSSIYLDLYHAYKIVDCFHSNYVAYDFFIDYNEYTFGVCKTMNAKFCIHTYNSKDVSMCFEIDSCKDCSSLMFCHNCENVHESLFCFNTKNKRYAVANAEVGKETYHKIRDMLIKHIIENLEKRHFLDLDIYNIRKDKGR